MSLFIASEAFSVAADFEAAKIAVFVASILAAIVGVTLLSIAGRTLADGRKVAMDHSQPR